ncbi:YrrS family protein [Bacillus thuringiensis]|uniref:YrrS family protein n=1 Tax=Bacillus thuringiensis TaxID=1428 RepID=UPI000BF2F8E2|nr:YrrS family protein [Bacillus thuringiensis]PEZ79131.1 FMN-dependent NADH-azoreductase [Bacillus thuringiensis]PFI84100.1 FMN-dependent NADH-azoreductase [Bacillus thuringiensis]PFT47153.1 FMN-dependent NADH-azoreductase [Bacillus thuringiensis]
MGQVSRFQEKQQNRRQKAIFNIAFTLVLVTVGIVTYQLFTASNTSKKAIAQEKKVTKIEEKKTEDKETAKIEEKKTEDKEAAQLEEKSKTEKSVKTNGTENNEEEKTTSQEKGSQTNPSWKPIGTEQGAKPEMKFKEGTVDWSEMKKAISYAVDVPESQLIFDFIGNNGSNKAYGNVRDKQNNKKYKVNIDWVENQGWKPVSVQVVR